MDNFSQLKNITFENGFFSHIEKYYKTNIDSTLLDLLMIEKYGMKNISSFLSNYVVNGKVSDSDGDLIAHILVLKYQDFWDSLKLVNGVTVDFNKPYDLTRTTTTEKTSKGETKNERTESKNLYGYDVESATNVSGNNSQDTGNSTGNETGNETERIEGHDREINISSMLQYLDLHSKNILDGYLNTIGSMLVLPTWDDD